MLINKPDELYGVTTSVGLGDENPVANNSVEINPAIKAPLVNVPVVNAPMVNAPVVNDPTVLPPVVNQARGRSGQFAASSSAMDESA